MRLQQLGCAVTAGKETASIKGRAARAKDASKRSGFGGAHRSTLVYGEAASV